MSLAEITAILSNQSTIDLHKGSLNVERTERNGTVSEIISAEVIFSAILVLIYLWLTYVLRFSSLVNTSTSLFSFRYNHSEVIRSAFSSKPYLYWMLFRTKTASKKDVLSFESVSSLNGSYFVCQ